MQIAVFSRVVDAVRHHWIVVLSVLGAGVTLALLALVLVHAKYTATTTVLMVAEPPGTVTPNVPTTATKPLLSTDLPSLVSAATVLIRFRNDLGEPDTTFENLRSRIHAKVSSDSTIMPVLYTAKTPEGAVRGANLLGDEIVRFYRETATTRFDSLIADFQQQLARRRIELSGLDGELAASAKAYPYIDVESAGSTTSGTQSVYDRLIALRTERDELLATLGADGAAAAASSRFANDARPLADRDVVDNDVAYRAVRDQYAKDFAALKKLAAFTRASYPGIIELRSTVAREAEMTRRARQKALGAGPASNMTYVAALDTQAKADVLYASDQAKLAIQNAQLLRLDSQIGRSSIATDVSRIRRDRDSSQAAYATIVDRLAKAVADRSEAASTGSVIVLDRAQFAPKALFSGGAVIAIGILILTVWFALTLAVMLDGTQAWFRDALDIESVYGAKVIGSMV